jgi:hypothetical protein
LALVEQSLQTPMEPLEATLFLAPSPQLVAEQVALMETQLVAREVQEALEAVADFPKVLEIVLVALAHRVKETLEVLVQLVVAKMVLEEAEALVL